jgi:SnoaL-like domain
MSTSTTRQMSQQIGITSQTELIDRYIAAWNEIDEANRKELLANTWTEDSSYLDPLMRAEGRDGINDMIGRVHQQFPGLRFRRVTEVDAHTDYLRFGWELAPESGSPVAGGVDFGTTSGGLLRTITGFLDFAPYPKQD